MTLTRCACTLTKTMTITELWGRGSHNLYIDDMDNLSEVLKVKSAYIVRFGLSLLTKVHKSVGNL